MKKILAVAFVLIISQSCNNDDESLPIISACDVTNPIENLPWLKTQVEEIIENKSDIAPFFFIEIAEYRGETIFISNNCCAICGTIVPIYNCRGELLGLLNDEIKINEVMNVQTIFSRPDSTCQ